MNLRSLAEGDLAFILEDASQGWPVSVTAPDGTLVDDLIGYSTDISQIIDPDTGQAVSGRLASVALRLSTVRSSFPTQGLPRAIADNTSRPWLVSFDDIGGLPYTFKIQQSNPDRAVGLLTCVLEAYIDGG